MHAAIFRLVVEFDMFIYYRLLANFRYYCSGRDQLHTSCTMDGTGIDTRAALIEKENGAIGGQRSCIWSSPEGGCDIAIGKHIFCNRSLNMKSIVAVGFDMDYTLAQYKPETFESLAYEGTVRKLVYDLGYPSEVLLVSCFNVHLFIWQLHNKILHLRLWILR